MNAALNGLNRNSKKYGQAECKKDLWDSHSVIFKSLGDMNKASLQCYFREGMSGDRVVF